MTEDPLLPERLALRQRLKEDLVGPSLGEDETLKDRPSDVYITGILSASKAPKPRQAAHGRTRGARAAKAKAPAQGPDFHEGPPQAPFHGFVLPPSVGLEHCRIAFSGARYKVSIAGSPGERPSVLMPKTQERWTRTGFSVATSLPIELGHHRDIALGQDILAHVSDPQREDAGEPDITVVVMNGTRREKGEMARISAEEAMVFQSLTGREARRASFTARPLAAERHDEDSRSTASSTVTDVHLRPDTPVAPDGSH